MDDLLDNFASSGLEAPDEAPDDGDYKYHFVDGSPVGSEHTRPVALITTATTPERSPKAPTREKDYEGDIDDYDDDDYYAHENHGAYPESSLNGTAQRDVLQLEIGTASLDRPFPDQNHQSVDSIHTSPRANYGNFSPPPMSDNEGLDDFASQLRHLHRQDLKRDELLNQLHRENQDLKRALKETAPGGNPRAEAAERSLFEIRKTINKSPYVCVLIDGKGYKIHEDLLQSGKRGGAEAADLLSAEVSVYLQNNPNSESWEIMVHLYIDIGGLLARCVGADIPLTDGNVRDFMVGFTQAQPLFTMVDVGRDPQRLSRKVEGMFQLFANNIQCKHIIFGCCHDSSYVSTLEPYATNPIDASSITLLKSYEDSAHFEGLPFNSISFPRVFRSTPFKATDRLAENIDYIRDFTPRPTSSSKEVTREGQKVITKQQDTSTETESPTTSKDIAEERQKVIAKWQETSQAADPLSTPNPHPRPRSSWNSKQTILLNINDERLDPPLLPEDPLTATTMKANMDLKQYCHYHYLIGNCITPGCKFRHWPNLSPSEITVLRNHVRRLPCSWGSRCRQAHCVFGHVCLDQPGCPRGSRCLFNKLHDVDQTVVRVWQP